MVGWSQHGPKTVPRGLGVLGRLGEVLGRSWGVLGPLWKVLGGFWAVLRWCRTALASLWAFFGRSWTDVLDLLGVRLGSLWFSIRSFDLSLRFNDAILRFDWLLRQHPIDSTTRPGGMCEAIQ